MSLASASTLTRGTDQTTYSLQSTRGGVRKWSVDVAPMGTDADHPGAESRHDMSSQDDVR